MLTYRFKVALDYNKYIYRIIEILENQTLLDFHNIIFSAFDRYDEHLYSFFMTKKATRSIQARYNAPEYTINFKPDDKALFFYDKKKYDGSKSKIGTLRLSEKDKFYYLFDFGDCWWHEITLLSIIKTDKIQGFPKIVKSVGDSPEQYPDNDGDDY
jgi:hypothetical protein